MRTTTVATIAAHSASRYCVLPLPLACPPTGQYPQEVGRTSLQGIKGQAGVSAGQSLLS